MCTAGNKNNHKMDDTKLSTINTNMYSPKVIKLVRMNI